MKAITRSMCALVALVFVVSAYAASPGIGTFDTGCDFSHSASNDPIIFPGQPGASHLHDFYGNTTTDAFSTGQGLLDANADRLHTTCKDSFDGAAYWTPALYMDGVKVQPANGAHVYYRSRQDPTVLPTTPFPTGFAVVSADHYWVCGDALGQRFQSAPTSCPLSGVLIGVVTFDQCWDGVNLHLTGETHVMRGGMNSCPVGYPTRIPALELLVRYNTDLAAHVFTLASGTTSTYHADFLNAWDPARLAFLVEECLDTRPSPAFCKNEELRP